VTLSTRRLRLVACPLELAQALLGDRLEAGKRIGAALPPEWPAPGLEETLPLYVQELLHDPAAVGWGIWISVAREANVVVGDAGFKGRPDASGIVEIGYGTAPVHRNRGYATEAVRALVGWALTHPEVERVVAECAPENAASIRVLEKAGLRRICAGEESLRWERPRPA